jgi:PAS domain S-box-containing protein
MKTPGSDPATLQGLASGDIEYGTPVPELINLDRVQEDGDVLMYRGSRECGGARVLVVTPLLDPPAPATKERLAHEHGLKDELEGAWAARPLELVRERGRILLILDDPGGVPLVQLVGQPMETGRFLRLAIGLVEAVGKAHQRGLIHKNIRPANVLVDEAHGGVHLTGFGHASRLPRERASERTDVSTRSLAYMAPEQTGRMNRSVDTRSDIYAVGVTLYETLTGALPFSASDPMEWVHCHIARAPTPIAERAFDAPSAIADIVMKCLAKTAEDRYQTAAGLASDLKRCLTEWESAGAIGLFRPGAHDIPDTLRISEKLYGREAEVGRLLDAFERVVAQGAAELVLVSGYSGVGKSSVVNELHKALVSPRGLFAAGKFDQYKRDIPYSTLAQAFQGLIRQLLGKSEDQLGRWRDDLRAALEPNAALMVTLVPDLKLIIGEPPPVPELPPQDADYRFRQVVRRFIGVFARPEHPLALFLDDLQWLDAATLTLLVDLASQSEVGSLLLVGAYRDNEVGPTHPLIRSLDAIRQVGGKVTDIVLAPLARDDVGLLIADSLHCTRKAAGPLTDLVYDKTGGNPFFTIQFLTALAEEALLTFDPGAEGWVWDLERIRAKGYTDNVVDLVVGKLARLPQEAQEALQWLAALGNAAGVAVLGLVLGRAAEAVHAAFWEAVRVGLVLRQDEAYAFLHDRVQEAAYSLISETSRAGKHLRIGRILSSSLTPEQITERIFDVVNQFDRGAALVDSPEERERIAQLDLLAGKRAKTSMAYAAALKYLAAGRKLLAEDSWERRYELTFALEYQSAECELLAADLAAAEERLTMLSQRARNLLDTAAVACLRMTLYTTLDRSDLGVEVCLEYQRHRGAHWSPHPTNDEVRREYEQIWRQLGGRSIEELIDLPLMNDPEICATLNVLTEVVTPALFTDSNFLSLVICRMVNLSLEHGNSDGSCFAYVWLGMILGPHFGDYQAGFRFGRLGYDLVEKRGLHRYQARAYMSFGNLVMPWTRHIQTGRALVRRAFDTANKTGDLTFAAYSCNNLNTNLLASGDPLGEVQREAESGLEFARNARFGLVVDIITGQLGLIRTLRGLTPEFGSFNDERFDESRFEHHLQSDPRLALPECWYWIRKLQARVYANDCASALEAASRAQQLLWTSPSFFEVAEYHFYAALARAAQYDAASTDERPQHLEALAAHHRQLETWAQGCPENFENRAALVAAEIARIEGRHLEAMGLYEQAMRSARENEFTHNEALAHELAGRFYLDRDFETNGLAHLRNARLGYALWGADGKVAQLDQLYPQLTARDPALASATRQLDVATLVKASQAVFGEIALPRLVETLMSITLQNAGADRGLLLLPRGESFEIEAEARASGPAVEVRLRRRAMTLEDGPDAVVNTVIRTRESLLLEDGARPGPTWENAFGGRAPPRSAFCLPLLRQARLAGVLYLENSQAAYAFTAERVAVLEVLAAQAAIAVENARLYGDLQERGAKIRRLVESNIIGIFFWTLDGRITEPNDAFLALVGYDRDDLLSGRIRWTEMTPAEWLDADRRSIDQVKAAGCSQPYEKQFFRKDGSRVPVLVGVAAFSGTPEEGVAFVLDLSERKQAEERQRVMVQELNHRVKNTLATVMAIASQTLRTATSLDAFREAFGGRLMALSKTHNLLNRAYWTGVSLRDLVEQELAPYADMPDGRLSVSGEDVRLGPVAAVTLGMGLHELASNAARFGAFSTPSGRVRVAWWPCEPGRLRLNWEEVGGPLVEPPRRRGFGSELLQRVLAAEVQGEVRLEFPPHGARCTMDMALDRITMH